MAASQVGAHTEAHSHTFFFSSFSFHYSLAGQKCQMVVLECYKLCSFLFHQIRKSCVTRMQDKHTEGRGAQPRQEWSA